MRYGIRLLVALVAIAGALLASYGTASAQTVNRIEVVQAGSSLWEISMRYGRPDGVAELMAYNGLSSTTLRVGQTLRIPPRWPRIISWFSDEDLDLIRSEVRKSDTVVVAPKGTAYSVGERWMRFANPAGWSPSVLKPERMAKMPLYVQAGLPLVLMPGDCVSLYPLGARFCDGQLTVNTPSVFPFGEDSYQLPSYTYSTSVITTPLQTDAEWNDSSWPWFDKAVRSAYFDPVRGEAYYWFFVPQIRPDGGLELQVFDLTLYTLTKTEMPTNVGVAYDLDEDSDEILSTSWRAGERVEVVHTYSRYEYLEPMASSPWRVMLNRWEGTLLRKENGDLVFNTASTVYYDGRCAEHCYSYLMGPRPPETPMVWYVDTNSFSISPDNLWLKDVVAPPPTNGEIDRINQRMLAGEVVVVEGRVGGSYDAQIDQFLLLDNGGKVPIPARWAPDVGTPVRAFVYTEERSDRWNVMALVESGENPRMWFFNYMYEKMEDPYRR